VGESLAVASIAIPESLPIGRGKFFGTALGVLTLPALWFAPLPLDPGAQHALAISALMVIFWIVEPIPHAVTGLLGCWLFWALEVVPERTVFSGFTSEAPWFLLGALFIAAMVTESGLARRLAFTMLARVGTSYSRILLAFVLTDFVMTFLVPAGPPRVILLGAIILGVVSSFGLDLKSNVARGLMLAMVFAATQFDRVILGSTPAILARSLIVEHGQVPVYWSQWLVAYLPADVVYIFSIWWLVSRLYPPEKSELPGGQEFIQQQLRNLGPWTSKEKRALAWTALAIAVWATDFLHHVSPAVVGLGIGLAATIPGIGVLKMDDLRKVNFLVFLFMGTTISMGGALRETQALDVMASSVFGFVSPMIQNTFDSALVLYWVAFASHLILASQTANIAVTMPVLMNYADANGLDALGVGLVWSFSAAGKLFIYQSLVLIAGYTFHCYNGKDVLRISAFFLIVDWVLLLGMAALYWPLLGIE
jgi:anion transporter